jgi:DUF438 domain-containing protein
MSEVFGNNSIKKEILKKLIKELHEGRNIEQAKKDCRVLIEKITPSELSKIEQELIEEGMPQEQLHKLCDVHIAFFKESLEKEEISTPPGHPIHILMQEHKILLKIAEDLKNVSDQKDSAKKNQLISIVRTLKASESHYVREENVLFPYLEKHGVTQPPAMMWMEHDTIREIKKRIYGLVDAGDLKESAILLAEVLSNHFYKENNILFPTAVQVITESEWLAIRKEFDDLGYCPFTPDTATVLMERTSTQIKESAIEGMIHFETGDVSKEEIESILNNLPVDITFVDKDDTVRYFSQTKERIFPRTKAVIGRKVQQCHPQKSIHVVNQILDDFKNGRRDKAEFWINMETMIVYIRYFPVRNRAGEYLGCLEVTQDIAQIQKIKGEKRLL